MTAVKQRKLRERITRMQYSSQCNTATSSATHNMGDPAARGEWQRKLRERNSLAITISVAKSWFMLDTLCAYGPTNT